MKPEPVLFYAVEKLTLMSLIRKGHCVGFVHKDLLFLAKIVDEKNNSYLVPLHRFVFGEIPYSRLLNLPGMKELTV